MITKEQFAELERLARAASPGPWEYQTSNGWHRVGTSAANRGRSDGDVVANSAATPANMAFIAAANPSTVLALLDRIAEQEQDAARFRWLRDYWHGFEHYRKAKGTIADLPREIDAQIQKQQVATATTIDKLRCTCPSGDGSLRWPCPRHPPSIPQ